VVVSNSPLTLATDKVVWFTSFGKGNGVSTPFVSHLFVHGDVLQKAIEASDACRLGADCAIQLRPLVFLKCYVDLLVMLIMINARIAAQRANQQFSFELELGVMWNNDCLLTLDMLLVPEAPVIVEIVCSVNDALRI